MTRSVQRNSANRVAWLKNLLNKIPEAGPVLGLSAEEISLIQTEIQLSLALIEKVDNAYAIFTALTAERNTQVDKTSLLTRKALNKMKSNENWSDMYNEMLQAGRPRKKTDPSKYKPVPKLKIVTGLVNISYSKGMVEGVNVYSYTLADPTPVLIGRATRTRFIDKRPAAKAGIAEVRFYILIGVIADKEVGHPSDPASIAFAG